MYCPKNGSPKYKTYLAPNKNWSALFSNCKSNQLESHFFGINGGFLVDMNLNLSPRLFLTVNQRELKDIHSTIYTSHVLYHVGLTPLIGARRDTVVYRLC